MVIVFWASALLIAYVYVGYPMLLAIRARYARRDWSLLAGDVFPPISIIVAARDEGPRLPARLENLLSIDYPAERRQIIVASDGSTDDTAERLEPYRDRVEILLLPRGGKPAALNAAVARAAHEILVFADARQSFAPDALIELTRPFADSRVGAVTGELVMGCEAACGRRQGADRRALDRDTLRAADRRSYADRRQDAASSVGEGVGLYWRYEKALRKRESAVHSTVGASGAIYALRRSLWRPLPEHALLDDVLAPMRAVLAGYRVVFNEAAKAFDRTAPDSTVESRRKIRTLAGNVQILWLEPRLLFPLVNPLWIQYVSHKVGRLIVPYALVALLAASIALAANHLFYGLSLAAQCAFYLLAGYGAWLESRSRANRLQRESEGGPSPVRRLDAA
jgi:cellulose synthase/poly-beta-1,6-N-acetylglucosamine synthase-like glycosyltransferase